MTIKVDKGANRLEQLAIDARLERLGVAVDPATKEVRQVGAKGSKVKGGFAGVQAAAAATGARDVLELSDLTALREKTSFRPSDVIARLKGKDAATISKAQLKGTAMTLQGAAASLERFVRDTRKSREFDLRSLASTLGFLNKATTELGAAVRPDTIGHASAEDLTAIRAGYGKLMDAIGAHAGALDTIVNEHYRPQARKLAAAHSAGSTWERMTNGIPVGTLMDIERELSVLNENVSQLAKAGMLFDPHPSEAKALARGLVAHYASQGVAVGGPKTAQTIEETIVGLKREAGLTESQAATLTAAVLQRYLEGSTAPGASAAGDAMIRQLEAVERSIPGLSREASLRSSIQLLASYAVDAHPGDFDKMLAHLGTPAGATLPAEHPHSIHA